MPKDPFDGIFTETQPQQSSSGFDGIFQGEATTLDGFQTVQRKESSIFDAPFKSSSMDSGLTGGLKAAGNLPSSALRLGKGVFDIVSNPITSAKAIGSTALGGFQKLIPGQQGNEQQFNQFAEALNERYGTSFGSKNFNVDEMIMKLSKTATEDPFGFATDLVGIFAGGATLAGRGAQAANLASKTAKIATSPITKSASAAKEAVTSTARFATSQATGLSPSTITEVIKNPAAFGKSANNPTRSQIAEVVGDALDSRLGELSDLGKGYDSIRNLPNTVTVPGGSIGEVLSKFGIKLDANNKLLTGPESRPLTPVDKQELQRFIDTYGTQKELSANALLNVREALSQLGDYNKINPNGKSNISSTVARALRSVYDGLGKQGIPGLVELDAAYAPERQLLSQLKRDVFDAQGNLKDGAISKIANITGKGKEQFLTRVKEIVPDIDQRINVLKAVEDIEAASGLKIGTYGRAAIGAGGIASGNIPVIIGAILSQPEVAVPLLRAYGYTGAKAAEVLRPLRTILEDVNNFRIPTPVIDYLREQQPGLSMKKVLPQGVPVPKNAIKELTATDIAKLERGLRTPTTLEDRLQFELDKQSVAERLRADKFPDDTARDRYLNDVLSEYNDQQGPSLLEGSVSSPGTVSSKQSTITNMSTSNALTGRGDVSVPKTDMSAGFDGNTIAAKESQLEELRGDLTDMEQYGDPFEQFPDYAEKMDEYNELYREIQTAKAAQAINNVETLRRPLKIYHGTSPENLASIKKNGVQIEPEGRNNLTGGGTFGASFSMEKNIAKKYAQHYGGGIHEIELPAGSKVIRIDSKGAGIDEVYTYNELQELKKKGIDAIIDTSEGQEMEVRLLTDFFNKVKGNK